MNLIVYGSLLNPKELEKHSINMDRVEFVKIKGYRRVFNQEPSWRKIDSNYRAVMNVEKEKDSWFNGLVIKGLTKEYIDDLDQRERGYDRVDIRKADVVTYKGKNIDKCIVYVGKKGKQNNNILPNKEYFKICLDGAKSHFGDFYIDYVSTTYSYKENKINLIIG